eukprot:jgi/Mesvir1/22976/Mv26038-RA.2
MVMSAVTRHRVGIGVLCILLALAGLARVAQGATYVSTQAALTAAVANASAGLIYVTADITVTGSTIPISINNTLVGACGGDQLQKCVLTVGATGSTRLFEVMVNGISVYFQNFIFKAPTQKSLEGGAMMLDGLNSLTLKLYFTDVTFDTCYGARGGALYTKDCFVDCVRCTFKNNYVLMRRVWDGLRLPACVLP